MKNVLGGDSDGATPVPIPNTEVKPVNGDGTAPERVWESSTLPGFFLKPGALEEPRAFSFTAIVPRSGTASARSGHLNYPLLG